MTDKPRGVCRYDMDECGLHCAHPLHNHFYGDHPSIWTVKDGHRGLCIGCPCHEPQPDPNEDDVCVWEWRVLPMSLCEPGEQKYSYWTSCGAWKSCKDDHGYCDVCERRVIAKTGHDQP